MRISVVTLLIALSVPAVARAHHRGAILYGGVENLLTIDRVTPTYYRAMFFGRFTLQETTTRKVMTGYQFTTVHIETSRWWTFYIRPPSRPGDLWSQSRGIVILRRRLWSYGDDYVDLYFDAGVPLQGASADPLRQNSFIQVLGRYYERQGLRNANSWTARVARSLGHNHHFQWATGGWGHRHTIQRSRSRRDVFAVDFHSIQPVW